MQLSITEIDDLEQETDDLAQVTDDLEQETDDLEQVTDDLEQETDDLEQETSDTSLEDIPENNVYIKVIKKGVHFSEDIQPNSIKPMHQTIPRMNAKVVRPKTVPENKQISYSDILSKMGMYVSDGKLCLIDKNIPKDILNQQKDNLPNQQSYIYNKYFKDEIQQQQIRKPRTPQEYKMMLVNDYIRRQRIKEMKSTKLIMPTSNIHFSNNFYSQDFTNLQNKLFNFPKR